MTAFRTLKHTTIEEFMEVFNLSFSDYFIPFKLSKEQLQTKIVSENINLNYSVGAFIENRLVGFILHAYKIDGTIKKAYNAGTGVIPQYRRNALTKKMYQFILPYLSDEHIDYITLEVLMQNIQAIKSYESIGFKRTRQLECFTGEVIGAIPYNNNIVIKELQTLDWSTLCTFWDIEPTWQNSSDTVGRLYKETLSLGAYKNKTLLGYIIFNPSAKKIHQLAVHKEQRRKGIASTLIYSLTKNNGRSFSIINVDKKAKGTNDFLNSIGLKNYLEQLEMELKIS